MKENQKPKYPFLGTILGNALARSHGYHTTFSDVEAAEYLPELLLDSLDSALEKANTAFNRRVIGCGIIGLAIAGGVLAILASH